MYVVKNRQELLDQGEARIDAYLDPEQATNCLTYRCIDDVIFPSGLLSLTFGTRFNESILALALGPPRWCRDA